MVTNTSLMSTPPEQLVLALPLVPMQAGGGEVGVCRPCITTSSAHWTSAALVEPLAVTSEGGEVHAALLAPQ
jgi:hypothetical protein